MLLSVCGRDKIEILERKERACIKSFCLFCKLLVVEIKPCVLSPLSVSKPPPVVSPTNNWYQSLVRQKNRGVVGIHPFFQSCQKQVLIISQCRVHPYELAGAKISFIRARGSPHAPTESLSL